MIVKESRYWLVNQRVDVRIPGYLMLTPKDQSIVNFADLGSEAALEMGVMLQTVARTIEERLRPKHLYVGRYGHMNGHHLHFHLIPVYEWLAKAFREDARYHVLRQFDTPGVLNSGQVTGFDGAEMTFFIWREYAEGNKPLPPECPDMAFVLGLLREALRG